MHRLCIVESYLPKNREMTTEATEQTKLADENQLVLEEISGDQQIIVGISRKQQKLTKIEQKLVEISEKYPIIAKNSHIKKKFAVNI